VEKSIDQDRGGTSQRGNAIDQQASDPGVFTGGKEGPEQIGRSKTQESDRGIGLPACELGLFFAGRRRRRNRRDEIIERWDDGRPITRQGIEDHTELAFVSVDQQPGQRLGGIGGEIRQ
jgi:hypothetical protein